MSDPIRGGIEEAAKGFELRRVSHRDVFASSSQESRDLGQTLRVGRGFVAHYVSEEESFVEYVCLGGWVEGSGDLRPSHEGRTRFFFAEFFEESRILHGEGHGGVRFCRGGFVF